MKKTDKAILPDRALFHADPLELLERIPSGQLQLVYLDPPFYINDQFSIPKNDFPDYLNFLARCLTQSKRILSKRGNLVLYFEPSNVHYFRIILDEIFGPDNFKNEIIVPFRTFISPGTHTFNVIVVYQQSRESVYNELYLPYDKDELLRLFPYEDEGGHYRLTNLVIRGERPENYYELNSVLPPRGYSWRYSLDKMNELSQDNRISYDLSKKLPSLKQYASESKGKALGSIWDDIPKLSIERSSYMSQQPLTLLRRIIQICSNSGDMVCDPFCGAGTTLVASELENRRWIGCDISSQAVDVTLSRLKSEFQMPESKIVFGERATILERFNKIHSLPDVKVISAIEEPLRLNLRQPKLPKPMVITEGKTDWKHIKAAYQKFKEAGYIKFDVDFHEFEESRGDSYTLSMCKMQALLKNAQPRIFIFDRDVASTVREVSQDSAAYKDWGNNVYSFALPLPQHRLETPDISIEFYYQDADLIRSNKQNRRLFLNSEFNPASGRHKKEDINCLDLNKLKSKTLKIIDERVFNNRDENIALTKDDFSDCIYGGDDNFSSLDIFAFAKIFEVIAQIMKYPDGSISIPISTKTKRNKSKRQKEQNL